jgi:CRP-like cAMP-binding protein
VTGQQGAGELGAFLASIPFFAPLDDMTRLQLAEQLEPVHVAAGDVVIAQGDPGDGLYLVLSGRLRVSVEAGGSERVLHDLTRGAMAGEIALLSKRRRSATVRAVRDSDLLMLRASSFEALVERTPALLGQMARLLVDRLLAVDRPQSPRPGSRTIAVAPAGRSTSPAATVAEELTARLGRRIGRPAGRGDRRAAPRYRGGPARTRRPGPERAGRVAARQRTRPRLRCLPDRRPGHGLEPAVPEPV